MKNINILYILIFAVIFCESCRKEDITVDEPMVTTGPSEEIEYPVATGIVSNNGTPIAEAKVNVYQNEILIGTVQSDTDGRFNTAKFELENDAKVTFEVSKSDFVSAYRRKKVEDLIDEELEVNLLPIDLFDVDSNPVDNPGSESLISLSGYVKDLSGGPSIAYIAAGWQMDNLNYAVVTYPDLLGYYEILLPIDQEVMISISDSICNNYLTEEEVLLFSNLQAEYFGPYDDDVVLPDYINPITSKPIISIEGVVKDCEGEPLFGSEITYHINDNETFDYYIVEDLASGGVFSYYDALCLKFPYDITVFAFDYVNNMSTDTLVYTITEAETFISLPDFITCNAGDPNASLVTVEHNNVEHAFSLTMVRKEGNDLISDELTANAATFRIPDVHEGINEMLDFSALNWAEGIGFIAVEGTIELDITILTENVAIGTFSGTFKDSGTEEIEASGTINLNF